MIKISLLRSLASMVIIAISISAAAQVSSNDGSIWRVPRTGGECITEPSPEPTAMRRYEDFPVSYSTGTADISIPLMDLKSGQINISLGLSYHTGGIKRQDISTYIGLGWTLNGLGSVSRQIHGFPDEWVGDYYYPVKHDVREYCANIDYLISIIEAKTDSERDIYHYNFPGYSGSFIIVDNNIIALPKTDVVITREESAANSSATDAFIIATPDGSKYRFAAKEYVDFRTNDSPRSLPEYKRDYTDAVTSWLLTKITGPDNVDEATITYRECGGWTRYNHQKLSSDSFSHYYFVNALGDGDYNNLYQWSQTTATGVSSTKFYNQLVPAAIRTRSGTIGFSSSLVSSALPSLYSISKITQRDNNGNFIKVINFDHGLFKDRRYRLDGISVESDNTIIDSYRFEYNDITDNDGYDIFGYPNGRSSAYGTHSIIDNNFSLSMNREPSTYFIQSGSLKSISDINGTHTKIEYEPSVIDFGKPRNQYQVIHGPTTIGIRIKSITTIDSLSKRVRMRSFLYEQPECNINLSTYNFGDFLSYNGTHAVVDVYGHYAYYIGICHTSSLNAYGVPLENSRIYYGRVTEMVSGSSLYRGIKTVYEYDLSHVPLKLFAGCYSSPPYETPTFGPNQDDGRFLGIFSNANIGYNERRMLSYYSPCGYIEENFGAGPLLTSKTEYEMKNQDYVPIRVERSYYSIHDKERHQVGVHSESRMFKYRGYAGSDYLLNIKDLSDIAYFNIHVTASRSVCDSTVVIDYFPSNDSILSRKIKTQYINTLGELPRAFDFSFSCHPMVAGNTSFYPYGTITSCGDESISYYRVLSEYAGGMSHYVARGLKRLPVTEKWLFTTHEGKDSISRNYSYSTFNSNNGTFVRPRVVSVSTFETADTHTEAIISKQIYSSYDSLGRITEMTDTQGRHIKAKWMDNHDLLSEMSLPDVGLTTTYTHRPLVGCTSITSPSGRKRSFSYTAGRLTEERNTDGDLVASYAYQLYGDGSASATDRANRFSSTLHDSSGSATDVTYYDGFGMPVQTVATVAGDNLVRSAVTYDALDRPVRQYLPVPADDDSYMKYVSSAAVRHYGDSHPFARMTYRNMAGDKPLEVIREGEKMQDHPERYEYLCNNTTDDVLRCRRYCLGASADSESITLDGDYPAGALDVTRATDPDGCTLLTFTDWRGLTMLERRVVSDTEFADTYYLYDILGNVRVILQPEGSSQMTSTTKTWTPADDVIDQYAFINRYDRRGNCVYAKVPGAGPVEMRYDPLGRLAMRRTPQMLEIGEFESFFYDPSGRLVMSGLSKDSSLCNCNDGDDSFEYDPDIYECIDLDDVWDNVPLMTVSFQSTDMGDEMSYNVSKQYVFEDMRAARLMNQTHVRTQNFYDTYDFIDCYGYRISELVPDSVSLNSNYSAGMLTGTMSHVYGSSRQLFTVFNYDVEGNAIDTFSNTVISGTDSYISNTYSRQGRLLSSTERTGDYELVTRNSLDAAGNLICSEITAQIDGITKKTKSSYTYDDFGRVSGVSVGLNSPLLISYDYNLRGQTTGITTPIFKQVLKYEDGTSPCYNGNISEMSVAYNSQSPIKRTYTYDRLNRLTAQTSTDGYNTAYSYNLNSSPLTVIRYGMTSDGTVGPVDDITFTYKGNQLVQAHDDAGWSVAEQSLDYIIIDPDEHTASYAYDSSGRRIKDMSQQITTTGYHENDRPSSVTTASGAGLVYEYDAAGIKHSVKQKGGRYTISTSEKRHVYAGSFEIDHTVTQGRFPGTGTAISKLSRVNLPWGYLDANGKEYRYITDYQGNIRAVVDSAGTAVQTTDYYPYGLPMATSTGAAVNSYKFSGKELETSNGLTQYDFEARLYAPAAPLFNRPDDLAGKYPHLNPYLYCAANPLRYIDPTGEVWVERYFDGVREIFYDRNVVTHEDLVLRDYYSNGKFSGVRLLEDGETINLGGRSYTFVNDSEHNKYGSVVSNNQLLPNNQIIQGADFDIFGTSDDSCDAASLHNNLMGTSYTGPINPYTYEGEDYPSYQYMPRNLSEYGSISHDKAYDRHGAKGFIGALFNCDSGIISADAELARYNLHNVVNNQSKADRYRSQITAVSFINLAVLKFILRTHTLVNPAHIF